MDCLFCKIARGEIPSTKVFENDFVLGFRDIAPEAPVHIVLIPKKHYSNILEMPTDTNIFNELVKAIKEISELEKLEEGFRIVNNCKDWGGQTVDHMHLHILGKRKFTWPPG